MSAAWGVVVVGGPVGRTRFRLEGGRSRYSLLPFRSPRVVRAVCAFVLGHPRPSGLAVECLRPSCPSRIRVERAATLRCRPPAR